MSDQPVVFANTLSVTGSTLTVGGAVDTRSLLSVRGTKTASTALAASGYFYSTLVAAANNDALTMVRIDPAFTPGVLTGLTARGLQISAFSTAAFTTPADPVGIDIGVVTGTGATNGYGLRIAAPAGATNNYALYSAGVIAIASASANAFAVGRLGLTTPAFVVDASTGTSITGVKITAGATTGGVAVTAIGETNVILTLNGAGTGAASGVRLGAAGGRVGFYGTTPIALQTGVAVTAAGLHAALVSLGLITA